MPTKAQEEWYAQREQRRRQRERFIQARRAENWYAAQLRKIADQIGNLTRGIYDPNAPGSIDALTDAMKTYAKVIYPWAHNTAARMLADVSKRDEKMWVAHGQAIGRALREEIADAPTGQILKDLLAEQVSLITSLPIDAAIRVHEIALKGVTDGQRGSDIYDMIMATGEVTKSRATLIARTETARTAANLTQSRAQWIGSAGYIWRNVGDADVRPAIGTKHFSRLNTLAMGSHRRLEGTFHRWDAPPVAATNGTRAHPGCIYNCRCFAEVVLPWEKNQAA